MRKVLVIGATSGIAQETAKLWAARGDSLYLVARDRQKLEAVAQDLRVRGAAHVDMIEADLGDFARHEEIVRGADASLGGMDLVLMAHGILGDQKACESDYARVEEAFRINFLSYASLLTLVANRLEEAGQGSIAVISSVAGDRGRQSNYVYGASKAALTTFAAGLRNRLFHKGVDVVTIKPGFVDTPMTASFKKGPLWAKPDAVAKGIVRAVDRGSDEVYLPWFWWGIMAIIKSVPEKIFKRLKL